MALTECLLVRAVYELRAELDNCLRKKLWCRQNLDDAVDTEINGMNRENPADSFEEQTEYKDATNIALSHATSAVT